MTGRRNPVFFDILSLRGRRDSPAVSLCFCDIEKNNWYNNGSKCSYSDHREIAEMNKGRRLFVLLLVLILTLGSMQIAVFAAQTAQPKKNIRTDVTGTGKAEAASAGKAGAAGNDSLTVLQNKVKELEKQYGVMKKGLQPFKQDAKEFFTSMESPFDPKTDGGILFTDIRDYDLDSAPELLMVRRERGTASLMEEGAVFDSEMYEYFFEMYEADGSHCDCSASSSVCVFDVINWSINFKSITVFLHETGKSVDICAETFISQQDHPSDTALVRMRYNGSEFTDFSAVRYGFWYRENGVRCMIPVSEEALNYLSDMFPSEETFWKDLAAVESEEDQNYVKAMDDSMKALGFKIVKTRQDIIEENAAAEIDDAQMAKMNAAFDAISAMNCYAPLDGTMTMMAFLHEYVESDMDDNGMATINRTLETK